MYLCGWIFVITLPSFMSHDNGIASGMIKIHNSWQTLITRNVRNVSNQHCTKLYKTLNRGHKAGL